MQYVQLVLTESQVSLLAGATGNAMLDSDNEVEKSQLAALADFLYAVEARPESFPVTDPGMARVIKKSVARTKGPAQPKRSPRKRAQLRAQGAQKRTRAEKRAQANLFNEAREAALAARAIEQAQEDRARLEALGIILPGAE
jgi:hypothetical protein